MLPLPLAPFPPDGVAVDELPVELPVPVADVPLVVPLGVPVLPVELLERELDSSRPTICTWWPTWLRRSVAAPSSA